MDNNYYLKECPFCGGKASFITDHFERTQSVICSCCKASITGRYKNCGGIKGGKYLKTRKYHRIQEEDWEDLRADLAVMWNTRGLYGGTLPIEGL